MAAKFTLLAPVVFLLAALPVAAHHSPALFRMSEFVSFEGTVTGYEWKNPHVFIHVESMGEGSEATEWEIEADGLSILRPHGWSAESLEPGDVVNVQAYPPRNSANRTVLGYSITKSDGTVLAPNPDRFSAALPVSANRAHGIAGVWLPRWEGFFGVATNNGQRLLLTERGEEYSNLPDFEQNPQLNCVPFSAPRIMVYPVHTAIEVLSDRVLIHVDWLKAERVVYTDVRAHPEGGERTTHGHTIARWEGQSLVMDTTLFSETSVGGVAGLPSGPQRRIEETLTLGRDGKTLEYSFLLEDPEYLVEPIVGTGVWDYRPDLEPSGADCDLEAARRVLESVD
jgi:hypothetical protein